MADAVHEIRVERCDDCPFVTSPPHQFCEHGSTHGVRALRKRIVYGINPPPRWCPLRKRPTLVQIADGAP